MSVVKPPVSAEALAYLEKQKSLNLVNSSGTQEFVQTSWASSRLSVPESSIPLLLVVGGGLVLASATATYVQHRRRVLSQQVLIEPEGRSVFNFNKTSRGRRQEAANRRETEETTPFLPVHFTSSSSGGIGNYDGSGGDGGGDGGGCGGDGGDGGEGGGGGGGD